MRCIRPLAALLFLLGFSPALAQTPDKVYRIAILIPSTVGREIVRSLTVSEMEKFGFIEGRNLAVEAQAGTADQLPKLARDLVARKPDVIIAITTSAAVAVKAVTDTIPIVMYGDDPVPQGLAVNHAHPGGNVTGVVMLATELNAKRLQLLHEAVPTAQRVAALVLSSSPRLEANQRGMHAVAASVGIELRLFQVAGPEDYPAAFAAMRATGMQALAITAESEFAEDAAVLIRLAREASFPTVCYWREMAEAGCLLSYGPSLRGLYRRTVGYVVRIFQGGAPGDLPIEEPTRFEFTVNLKTAKVLGIEMPPSLLARADEVIE